MTSATRARKVKSPEERRTELLDAAEALFSERGYESTSIDEIVERVGVAKGTFYYYFDSKLAVLDAIVDRMSTTIEGLLDEIASAPDLDALRKWHQMGNVINSWKLARREELLEILRVMFDDDNVVWRTKFQSLAAERAIPPFAAVIEQGVAEGVFATPYPRESAAMVMGLLQTANTRVGELLLDHDDPDAALEEANRHLAALHDAIERILGARPGSLDLLGRDAMAPWFRPG